MPGERLVTVRRRHWVACALPELPILATVLLVLLLDLFAGFLDASLRLALTLVVVAGAGIWTMVIWLRWNAASVTLTDSRLLLEEGVIAKHTRVIALDRVQEVSTTVGLLGRLLDFGEVEVSSAGAEAAESLDSIPAPDEFRDQIYMLARAQRAQPGSP